MKTIHLTIEIFSIILILAINTACSKIYYSPRQKQPFTFLNPYRLTAHSEISNPAATIIRVQQELGRVAQI